MASSLVCFPAVEGPISVSLPIPAQAEEILNVYEESILGQPQEEASTLIGKGAFCKVFRETYKGQVVAVKRLNVITLKNKLAMAKEHNLISKCNHPNIITLVDSGATSVISISEIRMPIYPITLPSWLEEDSKNRQTCTLLKILSKLFSALNYLQQQCGYVHGDVKPPNVLISLPECEPILIDFNLASPCTLEESMSYVLLPCDDDITGSPLYMGPERLKYPRLRHPASDVWAMGLLGYVMFAGEEPWPTYKNRDLFFTHLALGRLIPLLVKPAICPTSVWMVLNRCWQQNYLSRPTASTLSSEFAELSEQFLN